ncbi:MAG: hypothetical protein H6930_12815 [Rhodoferax sp.]|nr:hypothetical protein [Rhodoferax sp.]
MSVIKLPADEPPITALSELLRNHVQDLFLVVATVKRKTMWYAGLARPIAAAVPLMTGEWYSRPLAAAGFAGAW